MDSFLTLVKQGKAWFDHSDTAKPFRIVSLLDADGIASAAILVKLLNKLDYLYNISFAQHLTASKIKELAAEPHKQLILCGLGSRHIGLLENLDKSILVLDHHTPTKTATKDNITLVNPHCANIDGGQEISSAGITYYLAKTLDQEHENLAHLALIGALKEEQDFNKGINKQILDIALERKIIKILPGITCYGARQQSIQKAITTSIKPYIPGVTGNENKALELLTRLNIPLAEQDKPRTMNDLSVEEQRKLSDEVLKRFTSQQVIGDNYIIPSEKNTDPTFDLRSYATLLDACANLFKPSLGVSVCLGTNKTLAFSCLEDFQREMRSAYRWYETSDQVIKADSYIIINAKDIIKPTTIGTLTKSVADTMVKGTIVMGLAQRLNNTTKVSIRIAKSDNVDLRDMIAEICTKVSGEHGGHHHASGAIIPTEKEQEFIDAAKPVLSRRSMEEIIV